MLQKYKIDLGALQCGSLDISYLSTSGTMSVRFVFFSQEKKASYRKKQKGKFLKLHIDQVDTFAKSLFSGNPT